jgi:hypothetical protein
VLVPVSILPITLTGFFEKHPDVLTAALSNAHGEHARRIRRQHLCVEWSRTILQLPDGCGVSPPCRFEQDRSSSRFVAETNFACLA